MMRKMTVLALFVLMASPIGAQDKPKELKKAKVDPWAAKVESSAKALLPVLLDIDKNDEAMIKEWIRIAEIPAPSKKEEKRAAYFVKLFKEVGLEASQDKIGNVIGLKKGRKGKGKKKLMVCAHLDTVFGPEVNVKVRREGRVLHGPGVGDDTSGLINLATVLRLIKKHKLSFDRDIYFVATVQEELGLYGARAFLGQRKDEIEMVLSIDGGYGGVSYGALGIHWYKIHFKGQSRHTLSSMYQPSTTHALGLALSEIYTLRVPQEPEMKKTWYNVGSVGGGGVVNAQAKDAWFSIDLRSMDAGELKKLEDVVFGIARKAAYKVGVRCEIETVQKFPAAQLKGMKEHRLVQSSRAVLKALGVKDPRISPSGASDHCVAINMGIPGINIGTAVGRGAHSLEESVDTSMANQGIKQSLLIIDLMANDK
ncbi:MAG: M20/M25/M40 family metallo-hydrolase [Planctomycetota bacterium]|nr:M20/M25/M40 family metallo-hydrolase [Planctomycetota bacterium]